MNEQTFNKQIYKLANAGVLGRRTAAQKLCKSRNPLAVPALMRACDDRDPVVKQWAILGLCAIGTPQAVEYLRPRGIEIVGGKPKYLGAAAVEHTKNTMRSARINMTLGTVLLVGGALITWITYSRASSGGGTYFVMWGAMIIGLFDLVAGIAQYVKAKKQEA